MPTEIWLFVVTILVAAVAYFLKRILDDTEKIAEDVADMKPRVALLWADRYFVSRSPRQLNERGETILRQSGIKEIIDRLKPGFKDRLGQLKCTNPYDAERAILEMVDGIPKTYPELLDQLKRGAFENGETVDAVLFVGGLYLRNLLFPDFGFKLDDLDKPKQ